MQAEKITRNEKEDVGYVPCIVSFVTYIRKRNINLNRPVGMCLIMIGNLNPSILCYVLSKILKLAEVAQTMNVYYFIPKVIV